MVKIKRGQQIVVYPKKQCHDPKGSIILVQIGTVYRVTFTLNDEKLEEACRYGGYSRTYWTTLGDAESMYDEHLEWFKGVLK